jgi:ribosomal protein S18 acetylase RimI-like enzyme
VGLGSYAFEADWDALVLVMLSVLPSYQGRGAGRALLEAVQHEAAQRGLGRLMVVTTNDDLPALALYQRCGFYITEIIPDRVARDHDGEFPGFASVPVRDEIRLEYRLRPDTPTSRVGI